MIFLPKDFIETAEGLIFAVVAEGLENEKVRCFLRYVCDENKQWRKVKTDEANALLAEKHSDYLFHSAEFDADLHAVSVENITKNHQPKQRLKQLLENISHDEIEKDCVNLCRLFEQADVDLSQFGITGSLLIEQQKPSSDIDLVCYDLAVFHKCRNAVQNLIQQKLLGNLNEKDWQESHERRNCDLNFEEYVWHEVRKGNKGLINGRKFDLSLVEINKTDKTVYKKLDAIKIKTNVIDDSRAFCYPSEFKITHSKIQSVVCFTATYVGQAEKGETVEISGQLEQDEFGNQRIVVGSNREARGEYIKVLSLIAPSF
jgi:predicted nucleotidyltransferase